MTCIGNTYTYTVKDAMFPSKEGNTYSKEVHLRWTETSS